ncbi:hypothetical protein [Dickeya oryzae]|uniref:Uncharacterized protein n=1 Tax=Dickeya oryzae TaxID=1240404 RepID=A0AB39IF21_9GAMM|nr:hypothetical protein [Dickeya oryzae]
MMSSLNIDWKPEFGNIYTWFGMDRSGLIAMMVNNCFGDLPRPLLFLDNTESILDGLSEFVWEESCIYDKYPNDKCGEFSVDLYSFWRNRDDLDVENIYMAMKDDLLISKNYSEANIPVNKGIFVYHAVEGTYEGEDYPVGYEGKTIMGDYFRFLVPTIYASINDFPEALQRGIVVSDSIDFTNTRVIENKNINKYFTRMYKK